MSMEHRKSFTVKVSNSDDAGTQEIIEKKMKNLDKR